MRPDTGIMAIREIHWTLDVFQKMPPLKTATTGSVEPANNWILSLCYILTSWRMNKAWTFDHKHEQLKKGLNKAWTIDHKHEQSMNKWPHEWTKHEQVTTSMNKAWTFDHKHEQLKKWPNKARTIDHKYEHSMNNWPQAWTKHEHLTASMNN